MGLPYARRRRASRCQTCTRSGRRDTTRRAPHRAGTLRLLALALSAATARAACKATTLEFTYLEGDAVHTAIEDDIRADLAEIGITVTAKPVDKDTLNADMVAGNYDLVFSETYGAPYDPHSYIKSWATEDEAFYSALPTAGVDRDVLAAKVDPIFADLDDASRQAKWTALLQQIHNEVVALPLYGVRVLTVRGTQTLVSFTPLAFKLFCAARQNAVLRRSPFPSP